MLLKATADYRIGGYPYPTYRGEVEITFNAEEDTEWCEVENTARYRLRVKVMHRMCMNLLPKLTNLKIERV